MHDSSAHVDSYRKRLRTREYFSGENVSYIGAKTKHARSILCKSFSPLYLALAKSEQEVSVAERAGERFRGHVKPKNEAHFTAHTQRVHSVLSEADGHWRRLLKGACLLVVFPFGVSCAYGRRTHRRSNQDLLRHCLSPSFYSEKPIFSIELYPVSCEYPSVDGKERRCGLAAAEHGRQRRHGKTAVGAFSMVVLGGKPKGLPVVRTGLLTRQAQPPRLAAWPNRTDKSMSTEIIPVSSLLEMGEEPRILDVLLAEHLGFERERAIRELIARNRDELEAYGGLPCHTANPGKQGGRPGKAYWLNEGQALVICALSRTDKAAEIRKAIIDVFTAYRRGKLVDVAAHYRRPPTPQTPPAPALSVTKFYLQQNNAHSLVDIYISVPMRCVAPIMHAYEQIRH